MKVILKANWFAPGARRFKKSLSPSEPTIIPDGLRAFLPKSARIVGDASPAAAPKQSEPKTLRDFDTERAASDAFIAATKQAEVNRLAELDRQAEAKITAEVTVPEMAYPKRRK